MRRYRIDGSRYGGELVIGTISPELAERLKDCTSDEIVDYIMEIETSKELDERSWWEVDEIEHINGPYDDGNLFVTEVPADGTDDYLISEDEIEVEISKVYHLYGREAYTMNPERFKEEMGDHDVDPVLTMHSGEKGSFGVWFVECKGDFDPSRLSYSSLETDVASIIESMWYDEEELFVSFDYAESMAKGGYASVGYMKGAWHDKTSQYTSEYFKELFSERNQTLTQR